MMKETTAEQLGCERIKHQDIPDTSELTGFVQRTDKVALLYKEREIHLRDIHLADTGVLTGTVCEIANVCAIQYESIRIGQVLSFEYAHIQQVF